VFPSALETGVAEATRSPISLMDASPDRRDRSTQAPLAPERANAARNSFPRPRAAPVTTHVLPSRENWGRVVRLRRRGRGRGRWGSLVRHLALFWRINAILVVEIEA